MLKENMVIGLKVRVRERSEAHFMRHTLGTETTRPFGSEPWWITRHLERTDERRHINADIMIVISNSPSKTEGQYALAPYLEPWSLTK